jgi:hypothetical protein
MTALQLSGPEANTARQPGQEEEEMETEREEEEEEESEGGGRQERGRMDKKIDLQGQRHREVPLDSDRSGSLEQLTSEQTANERQTANEVAASHAVSRAYWSEKDHRRGFQLPAQARAVTSRDGGAAVTQMCTSYTQCIVRLCQLHSQTLKPSFLRPPHTNSAGLPSTYL